MNQVTPIESRDDPTAAQERLTAELLFSQTKDGEPFVKRCVTNAIAMMKHHPDWEGVLAFNVFTQSPMLTQPIPGSSEHNGKPFPGRPIEDEDLTDARAWFDRILPGVSKLDITDAFQRVLKDNRADPLKQYMEEAMEAWDGKSRIDRLFEDYFVSEYDDAYARELGVVAMMTQVLRALYPGEFQKMIPILEGKQNIGKSSGLKALCPEGAWFSDQLPSDLGSRHTSLALRGKFIIELGELDSITNRREMGEIKAFGSREVENYTPPYGKNAVEEPRRCMFWGTVNKDNYLRDETGSSRFYPIKITEVNVEAIRRDRDQLLGEAAVRLVEAIDARERWWEFSPEALAILNETRDEKDEDHVWTSVVLQFVEGRDEVSIREILTSKLGLGFEENNASRGNSNAVAGILQKFGWERDGKFTSGRFKSAARYVLGAEARASRAADRRADSGRTGGG
ncbi:MAG: VapE domain-containing protein [Pseudomonadota bacterium]